MALENDYEVLERLGEGAFGKVYKARHRRSGDDCAVKQIKLGAKSWDEALRSTELQALKALRHPYIVRLRELIRSSLDGSLYYIFEFISSDLFRLLKPHPHGLEEPRAIELTRQLFAGVAHIHQHNFFHRDIKPENILYDTVHDTIRIADFGEARSLRARPPFTDYVGTRWYRAPECLLRDRTYSSPVDVWASGLVFAELFRGSAVFCGTSSIDQLYKIFQVLGAPLHDWPDFNRLAEACRFRVPDGKGCGVQRVVPRASQQAQAVITDILTLNPRRRPLARKILDNPIFGQCPALDMDRLDTCRSAASGATPTDDRSDTHRSGPQTASSVVPPLEEAYRPVTSSPPHTPPSPGAPPSARDGPRTSASSVAEAPTQDVDLDAELDKILGGTSPALAPSRPAVPAPDSMEPAAVMPPSHASVEQQPPMAWAGGARTRSTSAGSFRFTPLVREGSHPRDFGDQDSGTGDCIPDRRGPPRLVLPMDAQEAARAHPESPASPSRSVDALLDSLCADLGVSEDAGVRGSRSSTSCEQPGFSSASTPLAFPAPVHQALPPAAGPLAAVAAEPQDSGAAAAAPHGGLGTFAAVPEVLRSDAGRPVAAGPPGGADAPPGPAAHHSGPAELPCGPHAGEGGPPSRGSHADVGPVPDGGVVVVEDLDGDPSDAEGAGPAEVGSGAPEAAAGPGQACEPPAPSRTLPWSAEEASQLRRAVKRVIRRGIREKEVLWVEVSRELGGARGPRECKSQYTRDYKAHKASTVDPATEPRERRSSSRGNVHGSVEPEPAAAAA